MNDLKPLLSDEEIREAAGIFARQFGLLPGGNVAMDFSSGARFARSIYEADRAKLLDEIEVLKLAKQELRDGLIKVGALLETALPKEGE